MLEAQNLLHNGIPGRLQIINRSQPADLLHGEEILDQEFCCHFLVQTLQLGSEKNASVCDDKSIERGVGMFDEEKIKIVHGHILHARRTNVYFKHGPEFLILQRRLNIWCVVYRADLPDEGLL